MSNLSKNETITELRKLLSNIKNLEYAKKELDSCKKKLKEAKEISTYDAYFDEKPTDKYQKECQKYISENKNRKETKKCTFLTVSIVIFVAMIVLWLCMSGIFTTQNTYLYTPEIIKEYSGTCYIDYVRDLDFKLNITACDENGAFQGTLEFLAHDYIFDTDVNGEFSVIGQIKTKSREGYVNATLSFNEWIKQTSLSRWQIENAFKETPIKIYDNYQIIRDFTNEMYACSSDYNPKALTNLNTPEIIRTYSGEFDPEIGFLSTASITVESCDESGKVLGTFEYSFKEGYFQGDDKWKLEGQIIEKYEGYVKVEFVPTEAIYNNYQLYDAKAMTVEIYDNYRSLECNEGMHWFYEDEGLSKDPNPPVTTTQKVFRKSALIVFPVFIALVIIGYVIISRQKTDVLTNAQKRKLDELNAQDAKNRQENQKARQIAMEEASKRKQSEIAACTSKLKHAADRFATYSYECANITIIDDEDKTIDNIEFLIHKLESGRADTLKEALQLLDEDAHRRKESNARAFWEFQESQRRAQEAANARADQIYHNMNVEYEQRRQTRELEKIRESLEDK